MKETMSKPTLRILASTLALLMSAGAYADAPAAAPAPKTAAAASAAPGFTQDNPFAAVSALPYHAPRFDKIKDEDYAPAFAEGMRQQAAEIAAIANNPKPPTFQNTIVALEHSGALLTRVNNVFSNVVGMNTNDKLDALETEINPKLAAHTDSITLNDKLFKRIQTLYDKRDSSGLDAESKRLLWRYYTDFVRAGAKLSAADKDKLKAMNGELARLQTVFSQNVLKEVNAGAVVVNTRDELAGLSPEAVQTAADEAKKRGMQGKYVIALKNTTGQPWMADLQNRALRQRLYEASVNRGSHGGEFDNRAVVQQLAKLRAERAKLLGYRNYSAYGAEDETAKTDTAINKLLAELAPPAVANAKREAAAMQQMVDAEKGGFQIQPWDWAYYTEKVRKAKYDFDETQLRPYFEQNRVLTDGVFFAATKLYGITFKERKDIPVYNADVRVFEVFNPDGKPLALFYYDPYARSNKRGGAWMNEYVSQSALTGYKPVVANHHNIPKPAAGEPTLLTFDEVRTLFHEFGHALHGMFSNVRYPRFAGTNVPRDFVEYPSQVNEMWAVWPEVLANYARHYKTGAAMPKEMLDKVMATKKFNQGFTTTEYLGAALVDQRWHQLTPEQIPTDVLAFEAKSLKEGGLDYAPVPPRYRTTYFSHSFSGGYSGGYYAYLWSEKLDADTVEWFKEHGGLTRKNGDWFRAKLLSRGGATDPIESFKAFRGREADIKALLERRGLTGNGQ
jgi:peptidyl-dipeptidase Dcp